MKRGEEVPSDLSPGIVSSLVVMISLELRSSRGRPARSSRPRYFSSLVGFPVAVARRRIERRDGDEIRSQDEVSFSFESRSLSQREASRIRLLAGCDGYVDSSLCTKGRSRRWQIFLPHSFGNARSGLLRCAKSSYFPALQCCPFLSALAFEPRITYPSPAFVSR